MAVWRLAWERWAKQGYLDKIMNNAWAKATGKMHKAPGPGTNYYFAESAPGARTPWDGDFKGLFGGLFGGGGDSGGGGGDAPTDGVDQPLAPIPGLQDYQGLFPPLQTGNYQDMRNQLHQMHGNVYAKTPTSIPDSGNDQNNGGGIGGLFGGLFDGWFNR